ncbi:MAG: PIN domain-containing protein [Thermoplasmata archaeon]
MRLVVDTNIIISALIRDSLTRKALLYPYFQFFSPEDIRMEIERNMDEIVRKSGVPLKRVSE